MFIKNKFISVFYKFIIIVLCFYGVLVEMGIFDGKINFKIMNYFTILSNFLVFGYLICSIIWLFKNKSIKNINTFLPAIKGAISMSIIITWLVYNFILSKNNFIMNTSNSYHIVIANKIVHYIVPIMMIVDYLLFDSKGEYKKIYPIYWIIIPYIYLFYVLIMAQFGKGIGINSNYPYPFLDIDILGVHKVFINVIYLTVAFILLGYLIFILDKLLAKIYTYISSKKHLKNNILN